MPLEPRTALPAPLGKVTLFAVYEAAGVQQVLFSVKKQKSCGSSAGSFSTTVPSYNYKARFMQGLFQSQHEAVRMLYKSHGLLSWEVSEQYQALTVRTDDGSALSRSQSWVSHTWKISLSPSSQVCTNVLTQLFSPREDTCLVTGSRSYLPSWLEAQLGAAEI